MTMNKSLLATLCSLLIAFQAGAQTLDSQFSKPAGMTDEEMKKAQEFEHYGQKLRVVSEQCSAQEKKLGKAGCDETKIDSNGAIINGEFGAKLEQHIGKVYGTIFGGAGLLSGSGGPKMTVMSNKNDNKISKDERKELNKTGTIKDGENTKAEQKGDYCIYGALGYELIAGMMQSAGQKQGAASETSDLQLQALISLKQAHKTRKRTALYQAIVYDATFACYAAQLTGVIGGKKVLTDAKFFAKMGGAAILAGLYHVKSAKHGKAEKAVQTVIDSLPKTGSCNPWTGTTCFCKEPSSVKMYPSEFEEVCVLNAGNAATPKGKLGCGVLKDGKMTYDPNCACKATNSCFKATAGRANPTFNLGANFMNDANKGYDLLSKGIFDQGAFDAHSMSSNANAKRLMNNVAPKDSPVLTAAQKKIADELKDAGPMAAAIAAADEYSPPGGGMMNSGAASISALSPEIKQKLEAETVSAYKQGGPGFGSNNAESEPEIIMPSLGGGETQADNSTEILSFAEEAISQADVTKTPETPIFDIISHRYRASGWTKLHSDAK